MHSSENSQYFSIFIDPVSNTHSDTLEVKPSTQLNPHLIVPYLFVCVCVDMLVHM